MELLKKSGRKNDIIVFLGNSSICDSLFSCSASSPGKVTRVSYPKVLVSALEPAPDCLFPINDAVSYGEEFDFDRRTRINFNWLITMINSRLT